MSNWAQFCWWDRCRRRMLGKRDLSEQFFQELVRTGKWIPIYEILKILQIILINFYRVYRKFPVWFPWNWVFVLLLAPKIKIKDVSSWFLAWGRFLGSRDRAFGDFDFTTDRQIILPLGLEKKWSRDDGDLNDAREGINCQRKK